MPRRKPTPIAPPRRTYGTGSVAQRKDGTWQAQLPRGVDPKRRATYHLTKTAAEEWVTEQLQRYARGMGLFDGEQTVGERVDAWLDRHAWDEATERAYRVRRKHLAVIDDIALDDLKKSHVDLVIAE